MNTILILTLITLAYLLLTSKGKKAVKAMATYCKNPEFSVRYQNIPLAGELSQAGIRSGQFGTVVKTKKGMFAKYKPESGRGYKFIEITSHYYQPHRKYYEL